MTVYPHYKVLERSLAVPRKQRFWDWFDGNSLRSEWAVDSGFPSTYQMADDIDQGFEMFTAATLGHRATIEFNDIRQYGGTEGGSVLIGVVRTLNSTDRFLNLGLSNSGNPTGTHNIRLRDRASESFIKLHTSSGGGSSTNTTVPTGGTNFNIWQVVLRSGAADGIINGRLEATRTSNIPTEGMQPLFSGSTDAVAVKTFRIRYIEVFNT